jgi:uncharacterized protein GlcG (DUF336 family)
MDVTSGILRLTCHKNFFLRYQHVLDSSSSRDEQNGLFLSIHYLQRSTRMAENTFQKRSITSAAAQRMIAAAEAKARAMGKPMCIAVCDSDGTLKAFSRMDGAALLSVQISQDKAYTAISFGMASHEWFEFVKNDPPLLHGIVKTDRLIVFGGGFPIQTAEGIIGGIGVSGGHWTEDMEVAKAGLEGL